MKELFDSCENGFEKALIVIGFVAFAFLCCGWLIL